MWKNKLPLGLALVSVLTLSSQSNASDSINEQNFKNVEHVSWHKQSKINPQELANGSIPSGMVSLFFIRPFDNDPIQSSLNIAVNDRFQTSIQPGSYSQVHSCAGANNISAVVTAEKTNNLLKNAETFNFESGKTYFIYTDVDENNQVKLSQITEESALEILNNKLYQHHLISRLSPSCPNLVAVQPPPVAPIVYPVLEEKVSIELNVLFDSDKAVIKPEYFHEISDVAAFMRKYGNTSGVIEGHTDSTASEEYNQKLSEKRALAVMKLLIVKYGIDPTRLRAVGYGESRPIATNSTSQGRQLNRRVIAVIQQQ